MTDDFDGAVAQLGERLVCNQEATGSIPVSSTNYTVVGFRSLVVGLKQKPIRYWVSAIAGIEYWVGGASEIVQGSYVVTL